MGKKQKSAIQKQIDKCFRELNVLKDLISYEYWDRWDLDWWIDQVEGAKCSLEKISGGDEEIENSNE